MGPGVKHRPKAAQSEYTERWNSVDGVASLTPRQRMQRVNDLRNLATHTPATVRRVYIPKPGKTERRGLSIPTMLDRALQALVKLALEPEWEARFEPNSYGFRPGRSPHDAIEVHHHDRNHNNNAFDNLRLMHGHCHDLVHGSRCL